ncbi:hypothetical protein ABK040_010079 [Willaertia magna]
MDEKQVVNQYISLFQRSHRYFSGLRELPNNGPKKLWQPYFQKTFEVFTQLWKYQLDYRSILEKKDRYGLKRYEIGEIASRIGQLYYHYYLRTSDTRYLNESFVFYEAIRTRGYFKNILQEENAVLYNKMLRYYARFIVVCLLLNKRQLVSEMLIELREHVTIYLNHFKMIKGQEEWELVIKELENFYQADTLVTIENSPDNIQYRLSLIRPKRSSTTGFVSQKDRRRFLMNEGHGQTPPSDLDSSESIFEEEDNLFTIQPISNTIRINDAILLTNRKQNVKFSELTLDIYRVMQSIERYSSLSEKQSTNARKSMLYRPNYSEVFSVLSNSLDNSSDNNNEPSSSTITANTMNATLYYISADGIGNGISLNTKRKLNNLSSPTSTIRYSSFEEQLDKFVDPNILTLNDILPFTRKPLFMIVESDNSISLIPKERRFSSSLICLASPTVYFSKFQNLSITGGLFTHFLSSPILALCSLGGIKNIDKLIFKECENTLLICFNEVIKLLLQDEEVDLSIKLFLDNDFTRAYLMRFMFCYITLERYIDIVGIVEEKERRAYLPSCYPPMSCLSNQLSMEVNLLTKALRQILNTLDDSLATSLFFKN